MKLRQLCSRPKIVCAKQLQNMCQACAGVHLPQKILAKPSLNSEFGFGKGCRSSRRHQLAHIVLQYLTLLYTFCTILYYCLFKTIFHIILHYFTLFNSILHYYSILHYFLQIYIFTLFFQILNKIFKKTFLPSFYLFTSYHFYHFYLFIFYLFCTTVWR